MKININEPFSLPIHIVGASASKAFNVKVEEASEEDCNLDEEAVINEIALLI